MFAFFLHKKFWLTIVILLFLTVVLEVALRLGVWNHWMHPRSFVKNAVNRVAAFESEGLENFHWISVGSSSFDWALNHALVRQAMARHGLGYGRFGFESGAFMSIQTSSDWAMEHLPNLQGIILGMPVREFGNFNDPTKAFKVSWPFLDNMDAQRYHYFRDIHRPFVWPFRMAIGMYGADILDFLHHPITRISLKNSFSLWRPEPPLLYNRNMRRNLCSLDLQNLQACVATAKRLKKQQKHRKLKGHERFVTRVCGTPQAQRRAKNNRPIAKLNTEEQKQLENNWITFFQSVLDRNKKLVLVLLPEHSLMNYAVKNPSADAIARVVIERFKDDPRFHLVDLRTLFTRQTRFQECQLYNDPLHFNNNGKAILTQALISALDHFIDE